MITHASDLPSPSSPFCTLKAYRPRSVASGHSDAETLRIKVKSRFESDFRRVSFVVDSRHALPTCQEFTELIFLLHGLGEEQRNSVKIMYTSADGTNLPISNDENFYKALDDNEKLLRVVVQNKAESLEERFGYGLSETTLRKKKNISISAPQDFRRVSSIIDTDILPPEIVRVRLCKFHTNLPLGFYIRDGLSERLTNWGPAAVPSIFISRLLPSGLAASTNLLHEGDEILEVNGIDICSKTLDQVTDIMVANAQNLVLTIRPAHDFVHHNRMTRLAYAPPPYPSTFSPMSLRDNTPIPMGHYGGGPHFHIAHPGSPYIHGAPEVYSIGEQFSRASINTASTSSGSSGSGRNWRRNQNQPPDAYPSPHLPPYLPPQISIRRIPRPFSVHTDAFVPHEKQVPIQAHRFSGIYHERY
ncbi:unnamed protein product, partial [Mesorhabditis spiculigera]